MYNSPVSVSLFWYIKEIHTQENITDRYVKEAVIPLKQIFYTSITLSMPFAKCSYLRILRKHNSIPQTLRFLIQPILTFNNFLQAQNFDLLSPFPLQELLLLFFVSLKQKCYIFWLFLNMVRIRDPNSFWVLHKIFCCKALCVYLAIV